MRRRHGLLAHDPEKWRPVFRKDHAPLKFVQATRRRRARKQSRASCLGVVPPLHAVRGRGTMRSMVVGAPDHAARPFHHPFGGGPPSPLSRGRIKSARRAADSSLSSLPGSTRQSVQSRPSANAKARGCPGLRALGDYGLGQDAVGTTRRPRVRVRVHPASPAHRGRCQRLGKTSPPPILLSCCKAVTRI